MDIGVHFVEIIPKGLDVIVGLDNQLQVVDVKKKEARLGKRHRFAFQIQEEKPASAEDQAAVGGPDILPFIKATAGGH